MKQTVAVNGDIYSHENDLKVLISQGWRVVTNTCDTMGRWMAILEKS